MTDSSRSQRLVSTEAILLLVGVVALVVSCQHTTEGSRDDIGNLKQPQPLSSVRSIPPHQRVQAMVAPDTGKMICTPWSLAPQHYCKSKSYLNGEFWGNETCQVDDATLKVRSYHLDELITKTDYSLTFDQIGRIERLISREWDDEMLQPRVNECLFGYEGDTDRLLFESCEPEEILCIAYEYDSSGRLAVVRAGDGPCVGTDAVKTREGVKAALSSVDVAVKAWTGNRVYVYDEQGLVVEEKRCDGVLENCETRSRYSYDERGRIAHSNYHDVKTWDFQFNDDDQLVAVDNHFNAKLYETRYEYDDKGRVVHEFLTIHDADGEIERTSQEDYFYECE